MSELNPFVRCVADFARAEAVAASQAELESKAAETEELVKQLRQLEEKEAQRAAHSACVVKAAKKEIDRLKAQLVSERERSDALEA